MTWVGAGGRPDGRGGSGGAGGMPGGPAAVSAGGQGGGHALTPTPPFPLKGGVRVPPPMERWSIGRVTLLGDACHSMVPFLAQGANMAIEDGYIIARALTELPGDVGSRLETYENARRERTRRAVEGSADNIQRFHNRALADPAQAREYVSREWAGAPIAERYEWLFRSDATKVEI